MGNHTAGELIVTHVRYLTEHRTNESALELLDLAIARAKESSSFSSDVEFDDDNHTDTPLGKLIFEAFAPNGLADIPRYNELNEDEDEYEAFDELYEATYGAFSARYELS